ncbi:MAG: hypothetical protein QOH99_588, partial [Frankiaceae bacterium]|nr:hypothetical protein [Frankiaceae bacterium]
MPRTPLANFVSDAWRRADTEMRAEAGPRGEGPT